jgi:GGDEF domain-containing protein
VDDAPVVVVRSEREARPATAPTKPPADLGLIDPVTGAGTVRALLRDVAAARSWDLPDVAPPAVIAVDLEPIPEIRRQVGDEAADRLLKAVVETIPWVLRARDRVYRIGPDDLALLMPSTGSEGVEAALVRLLRSIPAALSERGLVEVSLVPRPLDPATMEKGPPVWLDLPSEESDTDPEPEEPAEAHSTAEGDPAPVAI